MIQLKPTLPRYEEKYGPNAHKIYSVLGQNITGGNLAFENGAFQSSDYKTRDGQSAAYGFLGSAYGDVYVDCSPIAGVRSYTGPDASDFAAPLELPESQSSDEIRARVARPTEKFVNIAQKVGINLNKLEILQLGVIVDEVVTDPQQAKAIEQAIANGDAEKIGQQLKGIDVKKYRVLTKNGVDEADARQQAYKYDDIYYFRGEAVRIGVPSPNTSKVQFNNGQKIQDDKRTVFKGRPQEYARYNDGETIDPVFKPIQKSEKGVAIVGQVNLPFDLEGANDIKMNPMILEAGGILINNSIELEQTLAQRKTKALRKRIPSKLFITHPSVKTTNLGLSIKEGSRRGI